MGKCFSKPRKLKVDDNEPICLRQFELLRSVGRGAFGKVRIVRRKSDKELYAMKYINKEKCIQQGAIKNTLLERNLLEQIEYPLIVNLRYSFQDDENMFMVMDLMLGGDLKYHLHRIGRFSEDVVRLYAVEVSCALEYLHAQGIVHRDIKPDNLLLDAAGHVHLTDFNVAAYLPPDGSALRSFSGTLSYMAPEVIGRKGYREDVDWWSLGVVLYELLFGKRPFRGYSSKEIVQKIMHGTFQFPSLAREVTNECLDFITRLLQKDVSQRLGAGEIGLQRLKAHPFMRGIDWDAASAKKVPPPFVPDPERANFDAMFVAEDILLEDKPLKPNRRRSQFIPDDPNQMMIALQFKDFNFKARMGRAPEVDRSDLIEQSRKLDSEQDENIDIDKLANKSDLSSDAGRARGQNCNEDNEDEEGSA